MQMIKKDGCFNGQFAKDLLYVSVVKVNHAQDGAATSVLVATNVPFWQQAFFTN